ncbi:undecaprenyldiphospho-muramoylpentapeptide beta-N-acetylglucosaminyltransferase [Criibacterium bergeronii]|uniref:UDP-N-acetylglucosamine--N-acetylmuramyl-(pentapeptide) pyrophosphoryl-undecaprenol N-acetylglucosamine transferase n=1 Tax=Criibacterium bergeronii TaxID=1871336 RepID=A0A552V8T3_9FIRM|nr:undecaprenyldiphospho-muramoylpentapeptide beta-N-acetylglucosaminyltransferase [Criibacterium bergeronii]MBS6062579.1 undecaprenyldiphospho-muramoylpentapeptide beta-N-acetylglucosaminyltransferase [Peptostreptococcaceae bacterium]TRW26859.1 undecaprenyldiphospho-muramoylpentapeptide beta-N-acetylglucosaminyltransferase [Criibacterium bergeronii]
MNLIITGGGTGGHIYPALAIADYFKKQNPDTKILYVGGKYGIENEILLNYDYEYTAIDVLGFKRQISLENGKRVLKSLKSIVKMRNLMKKFKPDIVIGTGGYVTGPVVYAATTLRIKTAILEANVFMGMTNKILSSKVDYIFYGFDEAKKRYPKKNSVVSGNPVRTKEFKNDKLTAKNNLGIVDDRKIILSIGGSGGSDSINNCIPNFVEFCKNNKLRLIHVCGKGNKEDLMSKIEADYPYLEIYEYINGIGDYMMASDLIICSAGASTLSEVTYLGKPIIAIPKAYTAENHQEYNAMMIQHSQAGYCILEKMLTPELLSEKVGNIIFDENVLNTMSQNSSKLYKGDACKIIFDTMTQANLK